MTDPQSSCNCTIWSVLRAQGMTTTKPSNDGESVKDCLDVAANAIVAQLAKLEAAAGDATPVTASNEVLRKIIAGAQPLNADSEASGVRLMPLPVLTWGQAVSAAGNGKLTDALTLCRQANAISAYNLAMVCHASNKPQEAREALHAVARHDPEFFKREKILLPDGLSLPPIDAHVNRVQQEFHSWMIREGLQALTSAFEAVDMGDLNLLRSLTQSEGADLLSGDCLVAKGTAGQVLRLRKALQRLRGANTDVDVDSDDDDTDDVERAQGKGQVPAFAVTYASFA